MISADLSAAVSEALAAAGIPPERCGSARTDRPTDAQRQLYPLGVAAPGTCR